MRRILALCLTLMASPGLAAPAQYALQPETSTVGFQTAFGTDTITGQMPILSADLTLDFNNVAASKINVVLNAAGADASFPFAAQAMKGPKVLDTATYPTLTFQSTAVRKTAEGAEVTGNLTLRGATRPLIMQAVIWRQKGQPEGDLSKLTIRLTGTLKRSDYAATGWSDMVGDEVKLDILARIAQAE
jgi:polyisoprenoid-binding protein YceI